MKKNILVTLGFLFLFLQGKSQQQELYSQYMYNLFAVNPAYAGSKKALSANLYYRAQWTGFEGAPVSQNFTLHSPLKQENVGLGIVISNEKIGARSITGGGFAYSYKLPMANGHLSFGLRAGLFNYQYHWEELNYKQSDEPVPGNFERNKLVFTADFGVMYYTKNLFAGLELSRLNKPRFINSNEAESLLNRQLTVVAGKAFELSEKVAVKPSFLLRYIKNVPPQFDVNFGVLLYKKLWLSATYRHEFGYVAMAQIYLSSAFSFGYAYDISTNPLVEYQSGSHEVFLGYDFSIFKSPIKSPRYF